MKLTINGLDYTTALDAAQPLTIERTLNAPSVCRFALSLPADNSLARPAPLQSLAVAQDDGIVLFTGYVAGAPLPSYAGLAMEGPRTRLLVEAISDEILLDALLPANAKSSAGLTAGQLVANFAAHTGSAALATSALTMPALVSEFVAVPGAPFSSSAGQIASQVRAAYRATAGALALAAIPGAVHALSESSGTLAPARLSINHGARRAIANDVTVCGEHEPGAYVSEFFAGDGVTTQFTLGATPFFPPTADTKLIDDLFDGPAIDARVWSGASDPHFALGAGGLALEGGAGITGTAQLCWLDPVEMGGTLLLEADGVTLSPGSTGVIAGFFAGACVAGFQVSAAQGTGALSVQPLVGGALAGAPFAMNSTTQYTLRLRVHCDEQQRTQATYLAWGDGGAVSTGGLTTGAAGRVLFEIQPCVNGVLGMPVVLHDGTVTALPAACTVAAASSLNLQGAVRAVRLANLGSTWVTSTLQGGVAATRRMGALAESAECTVDRGGKLLFYTGFVPAVGEQIAVRYRASTRALGRIATGAGAVTASWIGTVTRPRARSSADCRNAASALAQAAASISALWSGTYHATQYDLGADVWPGDALQLDAPSCGMEAQVVVRAVKLTLHGSVPDLVEYAIAFANDWAEELAIRTSATVPADAWLPAPANIAFAANLPAMSTAVTGSAITLTMNAGAPPGGGFEVRRRDNGFLPGNDPSLAARGAQAVMTLGRVAAQERYYVRVFDGATPPNYSEFSSAVFINVPLGA